MAMRPRTCLALLLAAATLASAAACHAYRPGTLADLAAGDEVRTLLTPEEYDEVREHLVVGDRTVEGTVVEADAAGLLLEVPVLTVAQGIRVESYSQRLRIPASGLADIEIRSLDRTRTYALAGGVGALLGGIVWNQLRDRARQPGPQPVDPPNEDRIVLIRISF